MADMFQGEVAAIKNHVTALGQGMFLVFSSGSYMQPQMLCTAPCNCLSLWVITLSIWVIPLSICIPHRKELYHTQ